jgi:hypothetical protein
MDVLMCPSCARRYAVRGSDEGGWRCTTCSAELQIEQNDVSRVDLFDPGAESRIVDGHLHPLGSRDDSTLSE